MFGGGGDFQTFIPASGAGKNRLIWHVFMKMLVQETFADRKSQAELEVKVLPLSSSTRYRKNTKAVEVVTT